MHLRVILVAMVCLSLIRCDAPQGDGSKTDEPARAVLSGADVPSMLMGTYRNPRDESHTLTLGPMSLKSEGTPCNRSISFTSFSPQGDNKWGLAGEAGLKGMIAKVDGVFYFSLGSSVLTGCHQDGFNGKFMKEGTSLTAEKPSEQKAADKKAADKKAADKKAADKKAADKKAADKKAADEKAAGIPAPRILRRPRTAIAMLASAGRDKKDEDQADVLSKGLMDLDGAFDGPIANPAPSDGLVLNERSKRSTRDKRAKKRKIRLTPRMGGQGGLGEIDKSAVSRVIRMRSSAIKACYEKALRANPRLKGKLALKFVITPKGRVGSVRVKSNALGTQVASCVTRKLKSWRFPQPKKGTVSFNYTWVFAH